jgi:hypothetical protein
MAITGPSNPIYTKANIWIGANDRATFRRAAIAALCADNSYEPPNMHGVRMKDSNNGLSLFEELIDYRNGAWPMRIQVELLTSQQLYAPFNPRTPLVNVPRFSLNKRMGVRVLQEEIMNGMSLDAGAAHNGESPKHRARLDSDSN